MAEDIDIAVAGDALITRRLGRETQRCQAPIYDRLRAADASIVNLEMLLHEFDGYPASNSVAHFSGTYLQAPPWVADELTNVGFDIFSAASNHTGDYSHGGMLSTMNALESRDIPYAGLGRNLEAARAASYVDSPGGRVALIGAASTVTPGTEAGPAQGRIPGRPGLSPIRLQNQYVAPREQIDGLRQISESLGLERIKKQRQQADLPTQYDTEQEDGSFHLLDVSKGHGETLPFKVGSPARVEQIPNEDDVASVLDEIREANRQADWVVMSLHGHEGENGAYNDRTVAPFIKTFARKCIEAGADIFMGHGPHTLRGIEIYDGSPIFYSLGNFICQYHYMSEVPDEVYRRFDVPEDDRSPSIVHKKLMRSPEYWETVLPTCKFESGDLSALELLPVDLGYDDDSNCNGEPGLAEGEVAQKILDRLAKLSDELGTDISIDSGVGSVEF